MKRPRKSVTSDKSEEPLRLRGAIDAIDQGFQIIGADWRYRYVNAAAADHGRRSREELLGRTMMECYPGIEQSEMFRTLERCMTSRRSAVIENEFTYPDGHRRWFELRVEPAPEGITVLSLDVTARKHAEAALRTSEERYRLLFQANPHASWVLDTETLHFLAVNDAAIRLYGYAREEFLGMTARDIRPAEDVEAFVESMRAQRDGARLTKGWRHRRKDGSVIDVEVSAQPFDFEGRPAMLVLVTDVTERNRAAAKLREREELFRQLADNIEEVFYVADAQFQQTLYINAAYEKIWGRTCRSLYENPASFVEPLPPEDRAAMLASIERIQRGEDPGPLEFRVVQPDGRTRRVLSHAVPIRDAEGKVYRISGVALDITEHTELEAQYRQAQKMEAVGRLAGGVAHDFNNLLTVITSYSELLLEDCGETDPHRAELLEIRRAAGVAATLTRQLLAFSRQQVLEPRVLSLNDVVTGAGKMLKRLIGEDVRLVTTLASDAGTVRADAGQIEQVIMNLAVNARDAMPDGGALTLETANVEFSDEYVEGHFPAQRGRYVMLAVSDTGVGMSPETQARIFEPFFTTKEAAKGTGLGLATVYGIVKQSGGFIWVYSEPGSGTTFKIYLPRVDEAAVTERRAQPADVLGGTETVLLVEDSDALRDIASRVLERRGYTVLEASDGEAALMLAARHPGAIDLLLTDVVMPEMNGRQLAERLTALRPGLKVLYMSGYAGDAVTRRGVLEQGMAYLQKPFTPDALARKVREVLNG